MALDKLVDSAQLDADLTSVANAIRTKGGTSTSLVFPAGFVQAIADIPSGGGGDTMILYTNSNYSNVYVDANLTTTLADSYDYDYDAIYADIISASAVKVIKNTSGGGDVVNVVSIRYDKIDETFYLFVLLPSVNWGTNNWKSISIY